MHRVLRAVRSTWRGPVRHRWHAIRPAALLGLAVTALVLGTIGFLQYHPPSGPRFDFWDAVYRAITLFAFGGNVTPPVPTTLQIARLLAPVLTGYAALGTVLALFREQVRVFGIRLLRDHVIIAGIGSTGARLANELVEREPVVALDSNPTDAELRATRLHGVRGLVGDATDPVVLRRAGLRHARSLVVCCGSDGTSVDVAAAAAKLLERRRRPLTIFAHLRDLDLWGSLAAEGAAFDGVRSDVRLEYFNISATGAQLLLERHPPFGFRPDHAGSRQAHVLIVGLEGVGEQLVLQIARMWRTVRASEHDELRITFTGADAESRLADLRSRYPALDDYAALATREMPITSADFQSGAAMLDEHGHCDVTHAYVAISDEADALLAALALHARTDTMHVPVTVAVADAGAGMAILAGSDHGRFHGIEAYGVLSSATSHELLLRGTNELVARAQHAQWLLAEEAKGSDPAKSPNMRPWDELSEAVREENRRFADDLHNKLSMIGCMLVPMPLPDPRHRPFTFTSEELEQLAHREHERWMEVKLETGWRYGEPRDDARKIHDQIKPWSQLDEANQEKDRAAVREIPQMLALAGFGIQRVRAVAAVAPATVVQLAPAGTQTR